MEEKFIKLDDAEIFVLKTDIKPDHKNLVFVHGIGESLICFSEAFRELDGFNIIALDNAGFGQSKPASSEKHGTIDQAKRVFAVLDALNISVYCWGTESLSERSEVINFLETNKVPHQGFRGGSHWVMMDCSKDFYEFVLGFITN